MWAFFYFQLLYFWYRRRRYSSNRLRLETTTRLRIFLWHHDPDVFIIGLDAAFWRPQCLNVGHNYLWTPYTWFLRSCARFSWFYQSRQAYTSQWSWAQWNMIPDLAESTENEWIQPWGFWFARKSMLVVWSAIYMTDFAELLLGAVRTRNCRWEKATASDKVIRKTQQVNEMFLWMEDLIIDALNISDQLRINHENQSTLKCENCPSNFWCWRSDQL